MSECQRMEKQQLEKRNCILEAAKSCFLDYGFKRTSMADIAEGVGISRPALYLHFRNKKGIFRALAEHLHQETLIKAEMALRGEESLYDRILQAFEHRTLELFALVCNSTHGEELIDINNKIASDIFLETQQKFVIMLTQALQEAETTGEINLNDLETDARKTAELLVYSAHGLKQAADTLEDYRFSLQRLIKLFEQAVSR